MSTAVAPALKSQKALDLLRAALHQKEETIGALEVRLGVLAEEDKLLLGRSVVGQAVAAERQKLAVTVERTTRELAYARTDLSILQEEVARLTTEHERAMAAEEETALGAEAARISAASSTLSSETVELLEQQMTKAQALLRDLEKLEVRWKGAFRTGYLGSPGVRRLVGLLETGVKILSQH